jgi:hypothetical protein
MCFNSESSTGDMDDVGMLALLLKVTLVLLSPSCSEESP